MPEVPKVPDSPLSLTDKEGDADVARWRKWGLRLAVAMALCFCAGALVMVAPGIIRRGMAGLAGAAADLVLLAPALAPDLLLAALACYVAVRRGVYRLAATGAVAGLSVIAGAGDMIWLVRAGDPMDGGICVAWLFGCAMALTALIMDKRSPARGALVGAAWALVTGPILLFAVLGDVMLSCGGLDVEPVLFLTFGGLCPVLGAALLTRLILTEPA